MKKLMKIGELSRLSGVDQKTIRFYERSGLIEPAQRDGGGYRYYDQGSVSRLELIYRLKAIGLSLEEVNDVLPFYSQDTSGVMGKTRVIAILRDHLDRTNHKISELASFRDELMRNVARFEVFVAQAEERDVSICTFTNTPNDS
ncbi:MerR family transcriptional regulator [Puniceibacterium sp. IMCC21224]|uniref:MerR family transcriptional regulator n=1 Tax=Puniceibacterium sp. IMCC21224 TaxID=1618204 RepID=UPI00064D9214|nr:MerR family transcriptional regulator [Puniceibacterium sp. IMCC21224]KMK64538.1 putative transcriptional regulator [Puniceibacterium sp. IMCC21224]